MLDEHVVIVGAVLNLIGCAGYTWDTLRGRSRPNRVTWTLWAAAPLIAFVAEIGEGVGLRSLMTFMVGFSPAVVLVASFVNPASYWRITRFDILCGLLSALALALWAVTRSGDVAIACTILADLLAGVPTVIKAYRHPETESWLVFALGSVSAAITLLTVRSWTLAAVGFPLYVGAGGIVVTAAIVVRTRVVTRRDGAARDGALSV